MPTQYFMYNYIYIYIYNVGRKWEVYSPTTQGRRIYA